MADTSTSSSDSKGKKRRFSLGFGPRRRPFSPEVSSSKRDERPSRKQPTVLTQNGSGVCPTFEVFDDQQRVIERYAAATELLQEAIKSQETIWGSPEWAELHNLQSEQFDSQFINKINNVLELRKEEAQDISSWKKCRRAVHSV